MTERLQPMAILKKRKKKNRRYYPVQNYFLLLEILSVKGFIRNSFCRFE